MAQAIAWRRSVGVDVVAVCCFLDQGADVEVFLGRGGVRASSAFGMRATAPLARTRSSASAFLPSPSSSRRCSRPGDGRALAPKAGSHSLLGRKRLVHRRSCRTAMTGTQTRGQSDWSACR
eukprot:4130937-Heterocapsa_arctica.AAC.1